MPVTFAEIAPLLRGHYVDETAMWAALHTLQRLILERALRFAPRTETRAFATEVMADLALAISRRRGLKFEGEPPKSGDYTGFLFENVYRSAMNVHRRRRPRGNEVSLKDFEALDPTPGLEQQTAEDESVRSHTGARRRAADIWDKLRSSDCPPAYRLALFAWYWPDQLARDDLDALTRQIERGKPDQKSGLLRPVAQAWGALLRLWVYFPRGLQRSGPAQARFAWVVRSDSPSFPVWSSDLKALRAARETIGKWHRRGQTWLEKHAASAEGGAA